MSKRIVKIIKPNLINHRPVKFSLREIRSAISSITPGELLAYVSKINKTTIINKTLKGFNLICPSRVGSRNLLWT